jgi:hypothetical protein
MNLNLKKPLTSYWSGSKYSSARSSPKPSFEPQVNPTYRLKEDIPCFINK